VSLLQRSFPGRDSYPGDIFYLHARLLERAGSFEVVPGQLGSITCMPVAQTTQNDLTDYIVSNLIGITDGHILFDLEQFSRGRRPAISIGLSVTRLGRQTQSPLLREMNRKLSAFLSSNYEKSMQLSHFGSELSEKVQNDLEIGSNLYSSFNQDVIDSVPLPVMIIFATMSWLNFFHTDNSINIVVYRKHLVESFNQKQETKEFLEKLIDVNNFQELQIAVDKNKLKLLELCKKQVR